ncbi:ywqA [Symbiodinium sp. CCMP2456]|nr:ywqA [Symbiodinium sp. CCMP2456]
MKQSKLILNAAAIRGLLHPSRNEHGKRGSASTWVVRFFNTLFDTVLQDFIHVAKLQVSAAGERESREALMKEMMDLDLHTFQRHVDKLHGVDRASTVRRRLTAWLEGESDEEGTGDQVEQQARQLIREQIDLGVLRVNPKYNDSLAWVGDAVLDASLGLLGVESGLRPRELDQLRQRLFCTKRMGCDVSALGWKRIREAAERREQRVGELTIEQRAELTQIYDRILSNATVPRTEDPTRERSFMSEIRMSVKEARTSASNIAVRTSEWQDYGDGGWYASKTEPTKADATSGKMAKAAPDAKMTMAKLLRGLASSGDKAAASVGDVLLAYAGAHPRLSLDAAAAAALKELLRPLRLQIRPQWALRPHQEEGYRWLMARASAGMGAVLADAMGLGKTRQAIAYILGVREGLRSREGLEGKAADPGSVPELAGPARFERALVLAPSMLIRGEDSVWQRELREVSAQWQEPLRVWQWHGERACDLRYEVEAGVVPRPISRALQRAQRDAESKLADYQAAEETATKKKVNAERAAAEKMSLMENMTAKATEQQAQVEMSRKAMVAAEEAASKHDEHNAGLENALSKFNGLSQDVEGLQENVTMLEEALALTLARMQKHLDAVKASTAQAASDAEQAAQKAQQELRTLQGDFDRAVSKATKSQAESKEAADAARGAKKDHEDGQQTVKLIKQLRRAVDEFYSAVDEVVSSEHSGSFEEDPLLKPVLKKYNIMAASFMKVQSVAPDKYEQLKPAIPEIERNYEGAIAVQCDPEMKLMNEDHEPLPEFDAQCGSGLFTKVGMTKLIIPETPASPAGA